MAEIIQLARPSAGTVRADIRLWRQPNGRVVAELLYMPGHVIDDGSTSAEKMRELANWIEDAAESVHEAADALAQPVKKD